MMIQNQFIFVAVLTVTSLLLTTTVTATCDLTRNAVKDCSNNENLTQYFAEYQNESDGFHMLDAVQAQREFIHYYPGVSF